MSFVVGNPILYTDPSGLCIDEDEDGKCDAGPITDLMVGLPGSPEFWSTIAVGLDVGAWTTDLAAATVVVYGGVAGAGVSLPVATALGVPEVAPVGGVTGMMIAELYVQPILLIGNFIASISTASTIIADTKTDKTIVEYGQYSPSTMNSIALTGLGWASSEAFLSLTLQSVALMNDFNWMCFPFPIDN